MQAPDLRMSLRMTRILVIAEYEQGLHKGRHIHLSKSEYRDLAYKAVSSPQGRVKGWVPNRDERLPTRTAPSGICAITWLVERYSLRVMPKRSMYFFF